MSVMRTLIVFVTCLLLAACFSRPRAVVVERSTEPSVSRNARHDAPARQREYLVARGDTLYGIAFRNGVDFRELARWNGIASPYTIYPGQRLRLGDAVPRTAAPAARPAVPPRPAPTRTPSQPSSGSITGMPAPAATSRPAPSVPVNATATPATATPVDTPSTNAATPPASASTTPGANWRWPASGQIVSRYLAGDPTRQGINIAGSSGQPIYAAAGGDVVYSGAGLIGYGELVIIKHSDEFLSAYGHNRKRLVSEGQRVTAGQQIAEMGRSGAARDMLHFEIRRNGKPVDPLPMLPRR
jgi:lipoprotein NlpD